MTLRRRATHAAPSSFVVAASAALLFATPARAQLTVEPRDARFWTASAALLVAGAALDERLRAEAAAHHDATLERVASAVDPLGRARYLLPALAVAVVAPRVANRRSLSNAALRVASGYVAADGLESVVKPLVGRHRPDSTGRPWRFRPLGRGGAWGSFPSAHTTHAFAIAAGISAEARRPWVSALCYATAGAVGAQRVYVRAHWASDVVGGAALAVAASRTTTIWLAHRMPAGSATRVDVGPGSVGVRLLF